MGSGKSEGHWNYDAQVEANKTNKSIADENIEFQRDELEYKKALQQQIFQREDTAIQRQVADARSVGISPLAALGQTGAGAGEVVNTDAMNNSYEAKPASRAGDFATQMQALTELSNAFGNMAQTVQGLSQTSAQTKNLQLQNAYLAQTMASRVNSQRLGEAMASNNLRGQAYEQYYNEAYGITRNMSTNERLMQRLMTFLGSNGMTNRDRSQYYESGNYSEDSQSDHYYKYNFPTPTNVDLNDLIELYLGRKTGERPGKLTDNPLVQGFLDNLAAIVDFAR